MGLLLYTNQLSYCKVMEIWIVKLLREEYKIRMNFGLAKNQLTQKENIVHILVRDLGPFLVLYLANLAFRLLVLF